MKHLEVRQKYSAARRIFNSLLGVSSGDETLHLMFDTLHETLRLTLDVLRHNQAFFHQNWRGASFSFYTIVFSLSN